MKFDIHFEFRASLRKFQDLKFWDATTIFLCPDIRDLCILGVQGELFVEGMRSTVRRSAQAHCLPTDWSGTSSAG
jgi:hypothetical protein